MRDAYVWTNSYYFKQVYYASALAKTHFKCKGRCEEERIKEGRGEKKKKKKKKTHVLRIMGLPGLPRKTLAESIPSPCSTVSCQPKVKAMPG